MQRDKYDQGENIDGHTSDLRDLGHWSEDHRAETVSGDEEAETERCDELADLKLRDDAVKTRSVDGRADVDTGGEETDFKGDKELLGRGPVAGVLWVVRAIPVNDSEVATLFGVDGCTGNVGDLGSTADLSLR